MTPFLINTYETEIKEYKSSSNHFTRHAARQTHIPGLLHTPLSILTFDWALTGHTYGILTGSLVAFCHVHLCGSCLEFLCKHKKCDFFDFNIISALDLLISIHKIENTHKTFNL